MSYYINNSNGFSNNSKKGCQEKEVKKYKIEGTICCYPTGWYCDGYHEEQFSKYEGERNFQKEEKWQEESEQKSEYCHKCKCGMSCLEHENFEQENFYPHKKHCVKKQCEERGKEEVFSKQKNRCCFCTLFNCFK